MAAQWERLKTGLGIGPEPVQEPESLPSQLLHQLDEATTLSKTQVLQAATGSYLRVNYSIAEHALPPQRVYGFAICLGLGLLFGFLVSDDSVSTPGYRGLPSERSYETTLHWWFAVERFLFDASQVCHTVHFGKSPVYWQVCLQQIQHTFYAFTRPVDL